MSTSKFPLAERRMPPAESHDVGRNELSLARLRAIAQVTRLRRHQNEPLSDAPRSYIVRSGLVAISAAPASDRSAIVELLYPGDILMAGDAAPLPELKLVASLPCEFWRLSPGALAAEIARDGTLANELLERQNAQRSRLQLHVAILSGLSSEQRTAALLIEAACRLGARNANGVAFELPWSRSELADYLALNADTLSRIMSRLTHSGLLERISRTQLAVRDWQALLTLCPLSQAVLALHKPRWLSV